VPAFKDQPIVSARTAIFSGVKPRSVVYAFPTHRHYLRTVKEEDLWMSDIPQEIYDHLDAIKQLKGNVLVGGLGLGLVVKLLEKEKRVKSITVVELERDIIDMVWPCLMTYKSKVVHADLYDFLKHTKEKFDTAFFDIWASDGEHTLVDHVIPLRKLAVPIVKGKIVCWKESTMLGQVAFNLQSITSPVFPYWDRALKNTKQELDTDPWIKHIYAFLNWIRLEQPTREEAATNIESFIKNYAQPSWFKRWGKYCKEGG